MKKIILLLVVLVAAVGLGQWLMTDPGYVLVSRGQWRLEGSLGFVLFALLLTMVAVVLLVIMAMWLWRRITPANFSSRRKNRLGKKKLEQALYSLGLGNWSKADKQLAKAEAGDWSYVSLLAAAFAAHHQDKLEEREDYLQQAAQLGEKGELLACSLSLSTRFAEGKVVSAELEELLAHHPDSTLLRELACQVAAKEQRPEDLEKHLLALPDPAEERHSELWETLLDQTAEAAANNPDKDKVIKRVWKQVPKTLRKTDEFQTRLALLTPR